MISQAMLNIMTGWELADYVRQGAVDNLSSDLVMKIIEEYEQEISDLKDEVGDYEWRLDSLDY